ncbi:MAG: efflux RND transporter periplasmic adaptor subunit, partial [Betaproteobacteria bacterium]|nr:efflux RND transporter periplasmic adaptor subunit [Betaproteobacteria bacterium]
MKTPERKSILLFALAVLTLTGLYWGWPTHAVSGNDARVAPPEMIKQATSASATDRHIDLSDTQVKLIKVVFVDEHDFVLTRNAVGNIAFNDDKSVQVFSTYPGKITEILTDVGRDVKKGQPLYAVDSPDLLQAESTLISAAGVRELTTHALERAQQLFGIQGISQKDLQQAVSDQQSAEGAYKAARDAVRIFGKTEAQIDALIASRHVDATLLVRSPISGRVVARNAAPGALTQPGTAPAPFTVADISMMWMLANVP